MCYGRPGIVRVMGLGKEFSSIFSLEQFTSVIDVAVFYS
jgi:hypothetical protein